jgi:predicted Rossmann fold nucleotide-binding protein DprA/Smf involved in DNA uptake
MKFTDNAMSAILLCSYIGLKGDDLLKPLSLGEWNQFLDRIIEMKYEPCIVLKQDSMFLENLKYTNDYVERIQKLVSRGGKVAFALDDLSRKGVEVITLFDSDYPVLLKRKLKRKAPPILFYAGDIKLSKKIGIAVVGSRDVDQAGMDFTKKLVTKASQERLIIYSGGAKGVDTISENTAIECGSAVVSFIADSLLSKIKKSDILLKIMQGKMLLLSDVNPEVGFSAARAMNRNKLIYTAAYGAFVVSSDYNKGGTWSGAIENIMNDWTKEFVWDHKEYNGNLKLIEKGAIPYDLSVEKIYDVITKKDNNYDQLDIFNLNSVAVLNEDKQVYICHEENNEEKVFTKDIYYIVRNSIIEQLESGLNANEASKIFNVTKGQMNTWLKRLWSDGLVKYEDGRYIKKE